MKHRLGYEGQTRERCYSGLGSELRPLFAVGLAAGGLAIVVAKASEFPEDVERDRSLECQNTEIIDYQAEVSELPTKLVVTTEGKIVDKSGDTYGPTEGLHFSGLQTLAEDRAQLKEATTIGELQDASDDIFAKYNLMVKFAKGEDYPAPVVAKYPSYRFDTLLPNKNDFTRVYNDVDQLLVDEAVQPDEFREVGNRKSVSLVSKWSSAGEAFVDEDGTHSVRQIGYGNKTAEGIDYHEAAHNMESKMCRAAWTHGTAIRALYNQQTDEQKNTKGYREIRKDKQKFVVWFDKSRFISSYGAGGGLNEEWADGVERLMQKGYPRPQSNENPTTRDKKYSTIASIYDLYAPGSKYFFLAKGVGSLCFDVPGLQDNVAQRWVPQSDLVCEPKHDWPTLQTTN